jgi:hypothetical protein
MDARRFVFVGGLHRSGTTIVTNCIAEHPAISGFKDTGEREDEGQFLQSVYPTAGVYGGPGRFGFSPEAHLTEASPLVTEANGDRMYEEWSRHWDTSRPVLLEKSPPNLIRNRFLQALFPNSWFVVVVRHPIAVSYATYTRRPKKTRLDSLFEHWVICHERFEQDLPVLRRVLVVPYERFVGDPDAWLGRIYRFLELEEHPNALAIKQDTNERYFEMWNELRNQHGIGPQGWRATKARRRASQLEGRARRFGYSFEDLDLIGPAPALAGLSVDPFEQPAAS